MFVGGRAASVPTLLSGLHSVRRRCGRTPQSSTACAPASVPHAKLPSAAALCTTSGTDALSRARISTTLDARLTPATKAQPSEPPLPLPPPRPQRFAVEGPRSRARRRTLPDAGDAGRDDLATLLRRLERYSERVRGEVLRVRATIPDGDADDGSGTEDEVLVFRGFSSSLTRPTANDPAVPVLPPAARITAVDRIRAPYNPTTIVYLARDLAADQLESLLAERGL
eukprot:SM000074S21733  [mRNA]  locus=s74:500574:502211:- [translate_table: standard]